MNEQIEKFVEKSEGEWLSMRSGHALSFQQFEQIISSIKIHILETSDQQVLNLLNTFNKDIKRAICPFSIEWAAHSDWEGEDLNGNLSGYSILIPLPSSLNEGTILRSMGYAENKSAISNYKFTNDGALILETEYDYTFTEERVWFLSDNVRCRSSVISTSKSTGILQTSFSSEIKQLGI